MFALSTQNLQFFEHRVQDVFLVTLHQFVVGIGAACLCIGLRALDGASQCDQHNQSAADKQHVQNSHYNFRCCHSPTSFFHCSTSNDGQAFAAKRLCPQTWSALMS